MLTTPEEVKRYLVGQQWVDPGSSVQVEALSGGVSNQVWKIVGPEFRWVMKQALSKLKVKADWYSDVRRIERERMAMEALAPLLGEDFVPKVLHADDEAHTYVMTCAPENAVPWKQQLMQGRFDRDVAEQVGMLLGRLHGRSMADSEELQIRFNDLAFFEQLRLDPFYRYILQGCPDLERPISTLINQLTEERTCLVHGDYSPKNMLVTPEGRVILLDFEVSHWGNPLFDIAFCTAHFMLKGWALGRLAEAGSLITAFLNGYNRQIDGVLPHLGLMLLARVDGKSPVEYIADEELKDRIRSVGRGWIQLADEPSYSSEQTIQEILQMMEGENIHEKNQKNPSA
jgi:aminoglycoside phosphotransferase (APT) family kinase protein